MNKQKSLINIFINENNGQKCFIEKDSFSFKIFSISKKQKFDKLYYKFKLKKIIKNICLFLDIINNIKI